MRSLNYKVFIFYLYNLGRGLAKVSKVTDKCQMKYLHYLVFRIWSHHEGMTTDTIDTVN